MVYIYIFKDFVREFVVVRRSWGGCGGRVSKLERDIDREIFENALISIKEFAKNIDLLKGLGLVFYKE